MKILFIGHDASRTGAPILLLNFMKWVKINTDISFDLLLLDGGQLENEYNNLSNVYYYQPQKLKRQRYPIRLFNKLLKILHNPVQKHKQKLLLDLKENDYDLIYGNTIVSSTAINEIISFIKNKPAIIHVHELNDLTSIFKSEFDKLINNNVRFITVSNLTKRNLIENHNIPESVISLIYAYINVEKVLKFKQDIFNEKFIVNGSGLVQIRKGYDIFISIAKRAKTKYPGIPFQFRWIGFIPDEIGFYIKNDLEQAELNNYVHFIGSLANPYEKFAESSVFLMTSRQDPFPLVCLEHAILEKPILCFDKGTGISEFVEEDAGIILPYMDIEAAVDALALLYSKKDLKSILGETAAKKALNYDINIQAYKIIDLIKAVINS